MQFCFYNVCDFRVDLQGVKHYIDQKKYSLDVFCMQEAGDNFKTYANTSLGEFQKVYSSKIISQKEQYNLATLAKSPLVVIEKVTILQNEKEVGLALHTKIMNGNKYINIINVHGTYLPGPKQDSESRIKQFSSINEYITSLNDSVILGGDFNVLLDTKSVKMFEESKLINLIRKFEIKTTRNSVAWNKYPDTPLRFCDYVFVTPNLPVKNFYVPYNEYSDHLPMFLEI